MNVSSSSDPFFLDTHDANNIVDVIAPSLPIISIPICLLVLLNLCMQYFYALTVSPGFVDKPPPVDYKKRSMIRSASWSEKGVNIVPAYLNECRRIGCKQVRPDVSPLKLFFTSSIEIKGTV